MTDSSNSYVTCDIFKGAILKLFVSESPYLKIYHQNGKTHRAFNACYLKADNFQRTHLDTSNFVNLWNNLPNSQTRLLSTKCSPQGFLAESWDRNLGTMLAQMKELTMDKVLWQCHCVPHFRLKPHCLPSRC